LLDEVEQGESFEIVRDGIRVAEVKPVESFTLGYLLAALDKLPRDPEFAADVEQLHNFANSLPVEDAWAED
jgi:antitoxin (DNA-binding transcriptional repressor) of toxin-antitoxin stability system